MKRNLYLAFIALSFFEACAQETEPNADDKSMKATVEHVTQDEVAEQEHIITSSGTTLQTRINTPTNFTRTTEAANSFGEYLRNLPLKPHGSEVTYFDGSIKTNYNTYAAVVDLEIGNKNLHQCADAVMRLRAEYLWNEKRHEDIHFNFTNGFRVDYTNWMQGQRMVVSGNKTYWVDKAAPSNTYQDFWNYMELIFNYAGTLSLSKELVSVEIEDLKIGDVFIWGGSPGHAVIVIDVAKNPTTNEKLFLLAQSFMPAQETHILKNPNNSELSPWYAVSEIKNQLETPEYTFNVSELKRFKD